MRLYWWQETKRDCQETPKSRIYHIPGVECLSYRSENGIVKAQW